MAISRRSFLIGAGSIGVGAAAVGGYLLSRDGKILFDDKTYAMPITTDHTLPDQVDVAGIRGGFARVITALVLARTVTGARVSAMELVGDDPRSRARGLVSTGCR